MNDFIDDVKQWWDKISDVFTTNYNELTQKWTENLTKTIEYIEGFYEDGVEKFQNTWDEFVIGIKTGWEEFVQVFKNGWSDAIEPFIGLFDDLMDIWDDIFSTNFNKMIDDMKAKWQQF